jgi:hypothetical protein
MLLMRRVWRGLLLVLVLLVVAAGILVLAARSYLSSTAAADRVTAGLEADYGAPVQVGQVQIGMQSSSVTDLKLYEAGARPGDEAWATFRHVRADVSLASLVRGTDKVRDLDVTGADLTLRFDDQGRLVTRLPAPKGKAEALPAIHLHDSRLTLLQQGRHPFVVSGIDAELRPDEGRLVLTGSVHDPHWGDWGVRADLAPATGACSGTLTSSARVHVTQPMLEDLPFVGASVWANVRAEGDTPVEFTLRYEPAKKAVRYRVALEPANTHVHVTSIDLTADEARGKVLIEDALVRLNDVHGRAAEGTLAVNANLDFRSTPKRLTFAVDAEGLDLVRLPRLWKIPPQLTGRLAGHADLVVSIQDGHARTSGEGQGVITQARFAGFKADPIRLRLYSEGKGFRFNMPKPPETHGSGAALPRGLRRGPWPEATSLVVLLAAPPADAGADRDAAFTPGEAARRLGDSVLEAAGGIAGAGQRLLRSVPRRAPNLPAPGQPAAPPAAQPTSYLEANLSLQDVDPEKLAGQLQFHLPVPVSGKVSVKVRLSIPIDNPQDIKAYRVTGTAESPRLSVAGVELGQLRARVNYADGVLRLDELDGRVPAARPTEEGAAAGSFRGTARLDVAPPGEATASLLFERIPLDQVLTPVPGPAPRAAGTLSGTVAARAPAAQLQDVTAWSASAHVSADRLEAYGLTLTDARVDVGLDRGELSLPALAGKLAGASVRASGRLDLTGPYRYHARLDVKGADLGAVPRLVPDLRPSFAVGGHVDAAGALDGTLRPLAWEAKGTAAAAQLVLDTLKVDNLQCRWQDTQDRLEVTDLTARLYQGEVTGSATVPLALVPSPGKGAGPGRVSLDFKDLDVGPFVGDVLAAATPAGKQTGGQRAPVPVQGQATGKLTATLPPGGLTQEQNLSATVDLRRSNLRLQGLQARDLYGTLGCSKGVFEYHLQGSMAGGTIKLDGQAPSRGPRPDAGRPPEAARGRDVIPVRPAAAPAGGGRLRVENAELAQLWQQLGIPADRMPLRGTLDIDLPYTQESIGQPPTGTGTVTIRRLRWHHEVLAGEVRSTIRLTERALEIERVNALVGQGVLRGRAALPLHAGQRGWFRVALDNVDAARLLAPWPDLAGRVEGLMTVTLRGTLDHEWAGSGQVTMLRGQVAGVEVIDWRLPLDFVVSPSSGAGQVEVRDTTAVVAQGRMTGRASLLFDSVNRLEGTARFTNVDLPSLLRQSTERTQVGPGKVDARIDFAANDLRSINDVSATIDGSLREAQSLNYPVLQQIAPFLRTGQSSSWRGGDLRARLDRGVLRVQRLSLTGTNLQLLIEGTIALLEERLNLDVTANTGRVGYNPTFLRFIGLRIPAAGPIPVGLLLEASTYLSNRTVHLRVTGTVHSPVVQVEPVSLLSEEAVRFFINRTPLPVP